MSTPFTPSNSFAFLYHKISTNDDTILVKIITYKNESWTMYLPSYFLFEFEECSGLVKVEKEFENSEAVVVDGVDPVQVVRIRKRKRTKERRIGAPLAEIPYERIGPCTEHWKFEPLSTEINIPQIIFF
jgi:hypothetical protein